MAIFTTSNYFLTLGFLAIALLWGVSLWNGTVKALITASWNGQFEDGTAFNTKYTGVFALDFPISLLVAFFFYGTNGSDIGYQLFLIDAYSTLQSAFVWLYVESARLQVKPYAISHPLIWGVLWQAFGAAISLPFYYYHHLKWLDVSLHKVSSASLSDARVLPVSFTIGALVPAVAGMLPTWFERSARQHQIILAAWQPDPVWVCLIQALITAISSTTHVEKQAIWWTCISYLLAASSSTVGHLYTFGSVAFSSDPAIGFTRMYVPFLRTGPAGSEKKLANGPWLFLQYDLIIISLSSLSWAYILVNRLHPVHRISPLLLSLMFLLGAAILGPGATVSLALLWREMLLHKATAAQGRVLRREK